MEPQVQLMRGIAEAVGASPEHIVSIYFNVDVNSMPTINIRYEHPKPNNTLFHEIKKFKWQEV